MTLVSKLAKHSERAWGPYALIGSGLILLAVTVLWYWGGLTGSVIPEGKRYVRLADGFADTAPVAPGQGTQASMVSYAVPYQDAIQLDIPIDYPTAQTAVLLPETGVKLDGPEWMAGEEMLIEDKVHQVLAY